MKQSLILDKAQNKMRPGVLIKDGFLGNDKRNLIDILTEDDEIVKRLGFTHQQIANRMIELKELGIKGLGEFIDIEPHYEIKVDSIRGKLPCPFNDPGIFPKTNVTVRNTELNREITYTDLHIHMIYVHGFYEGKGALFRLEPEDLIKILDITN